ncbi:MAG: DMT family transporter [Halopseudomonas sp.]
MAQPPSSNASVLPPTQQTLLAIGVLMVSLLVFLFSDNLNKLLILEVPLAQFYFVRNALAVLLLAGYFVIAKRRQLFATAAPVRQLLRGVFYAIINLGYLFALREMPVTLINTGLALAPLLITALSPWLLKERVSRLQWLATTMGFIGVCFIVQPDFEQTSLAALLGLAVLPLCYVLILILSKQLASTESGWTMNFYSFAVVTLLAAWWGVQQWQPLSLKLWLAMLLSAVMVIAAFGLLVHAFSLTRAALLAPFEYLGILMALITDMWLWGVIPGALMVVGVGFILLCGGLQLVESRRSPAPVSAHIHPMDTHQD